MPWKPCRFPLTVDLDNLDDRLKDRQFLVVSFFGKSSYSYGGEKRRIISEAMGRSEFINEEDDNSEHANAIDMSVDEDRDIIYLNLRSCFDTYTMAEKCKASEEAVLNKGFLYFWSSKRYEHAKALLFLFQISHILVCVQPGHSVDLSYVNMFKSLDNLRNKVQGSVSEVMMSIPGLSKEWVAQARPCSPRLLFLFLSSPISLRNTRGLRDERKDAKSHKDPPIKRLCYALEDQIYRILRKARIITNIAPNSLFALPANHEFVYVDTGEHGTKMDPSTSILNTLYNVLNGEVNPAYKFSGPFYNQLEDETSRPQRCFTRFLLQHVNHAFEKGFYDNVNKYGSSGPTLWEIPAFGSWVQVANLLYTYFTSTLTSATGTDNSNAMNDLRDDMEVETIFSELRCKKILPQAISVYEEGLPPYYNTEYHNAKLLQAMSVFSIQARGPASEKYAEKLAAECQAIWRSGRVRCEQLSLTGNLCMHKKHVLPNQEVVQEEKVGDKVIKKTLASLTHSSGVQYIAACNCGRRQANREDPFTLYEANYGFYAELEEDCCKDLNHIQFPVFNPLKRVDETGETAGKDTSAVSVDIDINDSIQTNQPEEQKNMEIDITDDLENKTDGNEVVKESSADVDSRSESLSSPKTSPEEDLSLGKDEVETVMEGESKDEDIPSDKAGESPERQGAPARTTSTPTIQDDDEIILEVLENMHLDSSTASTQSAVHANSSSALEGGSANVSNHSPSKVESLFTRSNSHYLPHMKTLGSPVGLKPEFASWSLVLMGSSSLYSHSQGMGAMPGFMSSSKFLLPWEIPLTKVTETELAMNWPNILDYIARRATILPPGVENTKEKISVKVFVGFEYECPRGHRFMVSAPGQPMKSSNTMRGAAAELVNSDMPLYTACPCRSKSPPIAQLMRLHLVTPKAPVNVTLLPQVQPVAGGPVFVTGWDAPVKLTINSYWVIRLPYVYWGEGGAHLPPTTPPTKENPCGYLLKGCISIDEDYKIT